MLLEYCIIKKIIKFRKNFVIYKFYRFFLVPEYFFIKL